MHSREFVKVRPVPVSSNDNTPATDFSYLLLRTPRRFSGILSIAVARSDHVKLDFLANGVMKIQGLCASRSR